MTTPSALSFPEGTTTVVEMKLSMIANPTATDSGDDGSINTTESVSDKESHPSEGLRVFQVLVVIIGLVGTLANGLVAVILALSHQLKRERINILFLNQVILDLISCFFLVLIFSLRLADVHMTGIGGKLLCLLVMDEMFLWVCLVGSTTNLVIISFERYLMIVHPIWHKNHFRAWMIYASVAFTWIDGLLLNVPLTLTTSAVVDGNCYSGYFWPSEHAAEIYGIWYFFYKHVCPIVTFVYCYGRILSVVRRRLLAVEASAISTGAQQASAQKVQMNVIKTMIIITTLFVVCWTPNTVYYVLTDIIFFWNNNIYYSSLVLAFLNITINPFVYAGQYDLVKQRLVKIFKLKTRQNDKHQLQQQVGRNHKNIVSGTGGVTTAGDTTGAVSSTIVQRTMQTTAVTSSSIR